jgi:invasion protein IalB
MSNFRNLGRAALAALALSLASFHALAADAAKDAKGKDNKVVETGWSVRCPDKAKEKDTAKCEIFSKLEVEGTKARIAEFAIGFPEDKTLKKGNARGVIILPLGILLQEGITMTVDEGKPLAFTSRFCTKGGCFSFVDLDKDLIESMKKGKAINMRFKTGANQKANLIMSLENFGKALARIQ